MSFKLTSTGLCIGHLNVYHLPNKVADVSVLINQQSPHILGISETRIAADKIDGCDKISDDFLGIQNYSIFRRDYSQHGHNGLAAYVHNSILKYTKRRLDLEIGLTESLWLEIKIDKSNPLLVCTFYRNPSKGKQAKRPVNLPIGTNSFSSIECLQCGNNCKKKISFADWKEEFTNLMDKVNDENKNILILGDFNIDLKQKQTHWVTITSLFNLKQLIDQPTRVTDTTSTIIDHIYTNNANKTNNIKIVDSGISDHKPIFCKWKCKIPKSKKSGHTTFEYRNFKLFDENKFLSDVYNASFESVFQVDDAEKALDHFIIKFLSLVDNHAPLRHRRVKNISLPPWITNDLRDAMAKRDELKSKQSEKKKEIDKIADIDKRVNEEIQLKNISTEYKCQRNKVVEMQRKAKKEYFNSLIENSKNTATIWRAMNEILNISKKSNKSQETGLSADEYNNHFLSVASSLRKEIEINKAKQNINHDKLKCFIEDKLPENACFHIPLITENELVNIINGMKNKSAMGMDKIPIKLLKLALPFISKPLTYIYNICIMQNVFPTSLKIARVIPLPKSKDTSDVNNFRPISILPLLSKPLEKHIQKHLLKFMENNNLFHSFQSGFRPNHSCNTALASLCDNWLSNINESKLTGAVFLDFKKAFDLVDHSVLLQKLNEYIRNDNTLQFFKSYLCQRQQYVSVNCSSSELGFVECGVPQGSIIGPILFGIYINDLPLYISNKNVRCDLFADDSTLHTSSKDISSITTLLNTSLVEVSNWCKENLMVIHPNKTKSMVVTTRQKRQLKKLSLNLNIDSIPIEQVSEHKVLGVMIDDEMKWDSQINMISKKMSRTLFLMSKLKHFADQKSITMFHNAHIMPYINYASVLWDGAKHVHLDIIKSLYRRSIKIVGKDYHVSTDEKLKSLNMLPFYKQLDYNKAIFMFKVYHESCPSNIYSLFKRCKSSRSMNFITPKPRIDLFESSISCSGSKVWNSLPSNIKNSKTLISFKKSVHTYFLQPLQSDS